MSNFSTESLCTNISELSSIIRRIRVHYLKKSRDASSPRALLPLVRCELTLGEARVRSNRSFERRGSSSPSGRARPRRPAPPSPPDLTVRRASCAARTCDLRSSWLRCREGGRDNVVSPSLWSREGFGDIRVRFRDSSNVDRKERAREGYKSIREKER